MSKSNSPWMEKGWYFEANSASEVMTAIARVGAHGANHRFAWRGLANCNYMLTSSLHRKLEEEGREVTEELLREREKSILQKARDWGLGVEGGSMVDDLQLLANLQHFGVPTRLIDVTSNPMTALWFATQPLEDRPRKHEPNGVLIALNIDSWYNEDNAKGDVTVFKTVGDPGKTKGDLGAQLQSGLDLEKPFIVSSSLPNARLQAQEGYFVACKHPNKSTAPFVSLNIEVRKTSPDKTRQLLTEAKGRGLPQVIPFVAIFIRSKKVKEQLRSYLRNTFSRSAKTLFPDYQGFLDYGEW